MNVTLYGPQPQAPEPDPDGERLIECLSRVGVAVTPELIASLIVECNAQEKYRLAFDAQIERAAAKLSGRAAKLLPQLEQPYDGEDSAAERGDGYGAGYAAGRYRGYTEAASELMEAIKTAQRAAT